MLHSADDQVRMIVWPKWPNGLSTSVFRCLSTGLRKRERHCIDEAFRFPTGLPAP
jgi:hypothetical protein